MTISQEKLKSREYKGANTFPAKIILKIGTKAGINNTANQNRIIKNILYTEIIEIINYSDDTDDKNNSKLQEIEM